MVYAICCGIHHYEMHNLYTHCVFIVIYLNGVQALACSLANTRYNNYLFLFGIDV